MYRGVAGRYVLVSQTLWEEGRVKQDSRPTVAHACWRPVGGLDFGHESH
jgi:hypothetical protein